MLESLRIKIGKLQFGESSDIEIVNDTFARVLVRPVVGMASTAADISLLIDPETYWYSGGASLQIGPALLFTRLVNEVVLQSSYGLSIIGIGIKEHLSRYSTTCILDANETFSASVVGDSLRCHLDMRLLTVGTHIVSIQDDHIEIQ